MEGESEGRKVGSWFWAFSPLYTCGLATAPAMIWAAIHKRNGVQAIAAAGYTIAMIAWIVAASGSGDEPTGGESAVITLGVFLNWFGGFAHALGIRRWAFDLPKYAPPPIQPVRPPSMPMPMPMPPPMPGPQQSALRAQQQAMLAAAMDERQARDFAREVGTNDPAQAYRLQIGRVDIPNRMFPDGGLIDVNNVPADALATATALPAAIIERITTVRQEAGGFGSLDELSALTQLPPQTFDHLADRFYFPRRLPS